MVRKGYRREGRGEYKEKQNKHKRERKKLGEMYVLFFECSWLLFIVSYPCLSFHRGLIPTHSLQIRYDVRKLFLATAIILMKCTQWYLLQEQKTQYLHFKVLIEIDRKSPHNLDMIVIPKV